MHDRAATYRFGKFTLHAGDHRLSSDGSEIYLRPKTYETLLYLVEHQGHLVTKNDLLQTLWSDVAVTDNALTRCIKEARAALGDEVGCPAFVRTIPRLGYEFIAEVEPSNGPAEEMEIEEEFHAVRVVTTEEEMEDHPDAAAPVLAGPAALPSARVRITRKVLAVLALVVLAGIGVAIAIWLHSHHKPVLTEQDTVVLGDFANTTGEPVFDDTLKQALAVQLEQSPFLNVISPARVKQTLTMMGRSGNEPVNDEVGREVCQRTDSKALISGSIATLGSRYVLGVKALACASGDVLVQEQQQVGRKEAVLDALGTLASTLRQRLGESLSSVQKFDTPIAEATTSSLEALQAYSLSMRAFDEKGNAASIPLLQRALDLDPNFAVAYAHLANAHENLGHAEEAESNMSRAYELRGRVSQVERFYIESHYHWVVTGQLEKMIQVQQLWESMYPRAVPPRVNQGVVYYLLGQYEKSAEEQREALRLRPLSAINHGNLADDYLRLDRFAEAEQLLRRAEAYKLGGEFLLEVSFEAAFLRGDEAAMDHIVAASVGQGEAEHMLLAHQSEAEAYRGRLRKALEDNRRAQAIARHLGNQDAAVGYQMEAALWEAELGDRDRARQDLTTLLPLTTTRREGPLAISVWARMGDSARAQRMATALAQRYPNDTLIRCYWLPMIEALVRLRQNEAARALEALQIVAPYELADGGIRVSSSGGYPIYLRGTAYLMLGEDSKAAAEFERLLARPGIIGTALTGPLAELGLARACAKAGDLVAARQAYNSLLSKWRSADPDLPLLRQARAEYAKLP